MKWSDVPTDVTEPGRPGQVTSLSLLARVRAGDQQGWQRLVRLYGPLVYSWCRRAGLEPEDATDAVQEVFSAVSANLQRFRRERPGDSFRKWIKTIANNHVRDQFRRQRGKARARGGTTAQLHLANQPSPEFEQPHQEVESAAERDQELAQLLREATELVRADFQNVTWQAFWQVAVEGRATADVAADLGITANAVRIAKSRVRARLREELQELLE